MLTRWTILALGLVMGLAGCTVTRATEPVAVAPPASEPPPVATVTPTPAPDPPPAPATMPPPTTSSPPAGRPTPPQPGEAPASPAPPQPAKAPSPGAGEVAVKTPAPTLSPRVEDRARLIREVNARLDRASKIVHKIDPATLGQDHRAMHASVLNFVSKAWRALSADDLAGAQVLAEKASTLADELASAARK